MNPLVSICIPIFNGELFLKEALNSVISQSYRPLEIIVSDDNSTDKSLEIVKSFLDKTNIPIYIFAHNPNGIGSNWNNCVKKSNGEYIKFLFQDDIIESACIEKMVSLAQKDKEIGLVFCQRSIIYEDINVAHEKWVKEYENLHTGWTYISSINRGKDLLGDSRLLSHPRNKVGEPSATLIKRDVFRKVGYFNEQLAQALDYEFWYRLMAYYKVGFIPERLASFRLHNDQASKKNQEQGVLGKDLFSLEKSLLKSRSFLFLHKSLKKKLIVKHFAIAGMAYAFLRKLRSLIQ